MPASSRVSSTVVSPICCTEAVLEWAESSRALWQDAPPATIVVFAAAAVLLVETTGPSEDLGEHRLGVHPRHRVRTPGGVKSLQNLHDLPVRLLHSPSGEACPSVVRYLERCPGGTPHFGPTRPAPTFRGKGDQLSAEREMKCPPTRMLACPLSSRSVRRRSRPHATSFRGRAWRIQSADGVLPRRGVRVQTAARIRTHSPTRGALPHPSPRRCRCDHPTGTASEGTPHDILGAIARTQLAEKQLLRAEHDDDPDATQVAFDAVLYDLVVIERQ
jgi:hypothetical protein